MPTDFVEELRWRGILHDIMPDTETALNKESISGYIGFDPTSDSLHIGSLAPIVMLMHFQRAGHRPIVLVGGATGMIGDPSGKSAERNLLDENTLQENLRGIKTQLKQFLDFDSNTKNAALLVNNYDWMKSFNLIEFVRDVGKHLTVNYMMAKDSVKKRINSESKEGMSFTEFTYQLFQGFDFLYLYKKNNCLLQMGGSDQWGNITTGTELIRRKENGKAYGLTCKLITKADGTKFGKSEGENIWLDKTRTSPYKFYQYWLNSSDEDAVNYLKIFTFLSKTEIIQLTQAHKEAPHQRLLQKRLAKELTRMVHSQEDLDKVLTATNILFGKSTANDLKQLDQQTFLDVFEGVPQAAIPIKLIDSGLDIIATLVSQTGFLSSNSEARRQLKQNCISVNKQKVTETYKITKSDLINNRFVLLQKGKKNYFVIRLI